MKQASRLHKKHRHKWLLFCLWTEIVGNTQGGKVLVDIVFAARSVHEPPYLLESLFILLRHALVEPPYPLEACSDK
eukprot:15364996-Ditylum_brightwellii.AAC.2